MFNHLLVFTLAIATGSALANPYMKDLLKQLSAEEQLLGDKETRTVYKRQINVITVNTPEGEETTEILPEEGYEIQKPAGEHVCYVRSLDKEPVDKNGCVDKTPLSADQVPEAVAKRCGSRPMYALSQCENEEGEDRRLFGADIQKRGCYVTRCEDHVTHYHCYFYCI